MQRFEVEDDLVELVWTLAKPKPFEALTFSQALRRVLLESGGVKPKSSGKQALDEWLSSVETSNNSKKAASPSARGWVESVPELSGEQGLMNWTQICNHLSINPAGDSARRKLQKWVAANRPEWPPVPDIQSA